MKDLISFLVKKITGSEDFDIEESQDTESGSVLFAIAASPDLIGLIIGKGGKTIKNIRRIASIKAVGENKSINISVTERV